MNAILFLILIIIELGIVFIAFLLAPEQAGLEYWSATGWICLLTSLNWTASAAVFSKNQSKGQTKSESGSIFGALPAINIILLIYSLFSVGILLLTSALDIVNWTVQLVSQTILFVAAAVLTLITLVAVKGAQYGSHTKVSKSEILNTLRHFRQQINDPDLKKTVNALITYVQSTMPNPSNLDQDQLINFMHELEGVDVNDAGSLEALLPAIKKISHRTH